MATLLLDLLFVFIILHSACTDSSKDTAANMNLNETATLGDTGVQTHEWRLTVTDPKPKGTAGHSLQDYLLYIIPLAVVGSALCIILCLYSRKQQQN
ncbi:hypothetical protein DPEC_G00050480 [Dallia pectoralis]|uniref:Uncharacterized protein n=1 Tax=Dallia pectoralis TaxID=75939 RepID=A0ACC2HAW8_DALPE|nr:hypothetical protein DPEC_G00050480 [Dallia pectoralis]